MPSNSYNLLQLFGQLDKHHQEQDRGQRHRRAEVRLQQDQTEHETHKEQMGKDANREGANVALLLLQGVRQVENYG